MGDIGERQERLLDHDIAANPTGEHEVNLTQGWVRFTLSFYSFTAAYIQVVQSCC
jgi:hypothetical protein